MVLTSRSNWRMGGTLCILRQQVALAVKTARSKTPVASLCVACVMNCFVADG